LKRKERKLTKQAANFEFIMLMRLLRRSQSEELAVAAVLFAEKLLFSRCFVEAPWRDEIGDDETSVTFVCSSPHLLMISPEPSLLTFST